MRDISYVEHTVGTSEVVPSGGPLFSYKVAKVGPQLKSISLQHFSNDVYQFTLWEKRGPTTKDKFSASHHEKMGVKADPSCTLHSLQAEVWQKKIIFSPVWTLVISNKDLQDYFSD